MLKGGWKVSECLGSDANLATISWTEPDHLCCEWLSESSETAISVSKIPKHFCVRKTCLKPEYQQTVIRHDHAAHVEGTEWRVGKSKPVTSSHEKKKKLPTPRWTEARSSLLWEGEQTHTVEKIFTHFKVRSYTNMTFCFSHTKIHHDYVL